MIPEKKPSLRVCQCRGVLGYSQDKVIHVHLLGCPEDSYEKEYYAMPWYKRILYRSPEKIYSQHFLP